MYGQFLVIFALLFTGYFCKKINLLNNEISRGLSKFIIHVSLPCFLFLKVSGMEIQAGLWGNFALALFLPVSAMVISGVYVFWYARLRKFPEEDSSTAEIMMVYPNNGFMGFPISYLFFGDMGLLFMFPHNIALNLTMFSFAIFTLRRNGKDRFSAKMLLKCLLNPNILALAAGFVFCWFTLTVPELIGKYLEYLGGIATPMAMVIIGSMLYGTNMLKVMREKIVLESVINKIVVMPLLAALIVMFFPLPAIAKAMVIFGSCFPSATTLTILAESEGKNGELASKIVAVSTAVSMVSLPIAVNLINLLIL